MAVGGNVQDWCVWVASLETDPSKVLATTSAYRERPGDEDIGYVFRGGAWNFEGALCRTARYSSSGAWSPMLRYAYVGFRPARSYPNRGPD